MSRKTAYERENDHLEGEIERLKREHREALDAKNREIARLRSRVPEQIKTLFAAYPNLRYTLELLNKILDLADPISSVAYDREAHVTTDSLTSRPIEGQGTQRDRERLVWAGGEVAKLAHELEYSIRPRDAVMYETRVSGGPQCWRRQCVDEEGKPTRGRRQSWENDVCQWCGQPFGAYRRWDEREEEAS